MEMLQHSGIRRTLRRFLGITLVAAGVLLVIAAGGYYLYGLIATEGLDSLVYTPGAESPSLPVASSMTLEGLRSQASSSAVTSETGTSASVDPSSLTLYPGEGMAFNYWAEPWAAEPPSSVGEELIEGFIPVDRFVLGKMGSLSQATRIKIPAIGLEADVRELGIEDLGDSRRYETPKRVVGFIPDTANPGELGNGWLFGHLQSPIRSEGAVFRDLPKIPEVLRTGQRVYVVLESQTGSYLYEVRETDVMYQDELNLYGTDGPTMTLVTCVPEFKYDYRLLVTAKLIGFKRA